MNKDTVDQFLNAFFAPPNRLQMEVVQQDTRLQVFSEYVDDLRAGTGAAVVLPCWRQNAVEYYGIAFDEHGFRQLGNDLTAFVGPSYSTFANKRSELDSTDPIDASVSRFSAGYVYKFAADSCADGARRVTHKLALMRDLSLQRKTRQRRQRLPLHMLLRDYYMAIEALNRSNAEKAIEAMRMDGLLDAINLLFLRSFVICRFGSLDELRSSSRLADLLTIRRPLALTEELVSLIYRTELAGFENPLDTPAAIQHFKLNVLPTYSDLYRSWHPMRSADAAKSFMLLAAASTPPDLQLCNAILESKDNFGTSDAEWLQEVAATVPSKLPVESRSMPATIDAQLADALARPITVENIRVLCRYAAFADSLDLREAIRSRYSQLPPEAQKELRRSQGASVILDEFLSVSAEDKAVPIPQNWAEWLKTLEDTDTPYWPKAVEYARRGASEWMLPDGNTDPQILSAALIRLQSRPELRLAFPHLIESARRDAFWPRVDWRICYEAMMDIIASYTEGNVDDLAVWSELVEVMLQLGLSQKRYGQICNDAMDLWNSHASAAILDWATEFLDTLLYFPCPDSAARLNFFLSVANRVNSFKRLLEPRQLSFLRVLAQDFSQPEWTAEFSAHLSATVEEGPSVFESLNGKLVAIYSLTERVTRRVKALLAALSPQADVRINSDLVGTPTLKKLSRDADIFIVNTASAKHAATMYISANRPSTAATLFHNARGSQSMLIALQQYLEALNS